MKKILLSLTAAAALAAAVTPAAAQSWRGHDSYAGGYDRRSDNDSRSEIRAQEWRIRSAAEQGRISRGEARQLMAELAQLRPLAWRVENGRSNNWEYQQLARGLGHVQAGLNVYASRREDRYSQSNYRNDWRR